MHCWLESRSLGDKSPLEARDQEIGKESVTQILHIGILVKRSEEKIHPEVKVRILIVL